MPNPSKVAYEFLVVLVLFLRDFTLLQSATTTRVDIILLALIVLNAIGSLINSQ